jgi:hypothetical protein
VFRISTGLLLYDVINEGSPNCSMSSQRRTILNRPTQGLGPSAAGDGALSALLVLLVKLPLNRRDAPVGACAAGAATGGGLKNSGASMQYWANRRTALGAVRRSRKASAVSYVWSSISYVALLWEQFISAFTRNST